MKSVDFQSGVFFSRLRKRSFLVRTFSDAARKIIAPLGGVKRVGPFQIVHRPRVSGVVERLHEEGFKTGFL